MALTCLTATAILTYGASAEASAAHGTLQPGASRLAGWDGQSGSPPDQAADEAFRIHPTLARTGARLHHGAINNSQVGEDILALSYRQVLRHFGPALKTSRRHGQRRLFYLTVGEATGWLFCFKGTRMVSASGDQRPASA